MPVFFNGRLWVSPATMSAVDDTAMANRNLTVGNILAILGQSKGGQPNTVLRFGNPSDADAALISGELHDAVMKAFDPSAQTGGPSTVVAIRVNPAVQSALALVDSLAATVINLASTDYGLYTNQIKVKIETATNFGKKLTTQFGNNFYTQDDVHRNAFSIQYSGGQASARMSVTNTTITLEAPNGTNVATIDLNTFPTIQQVVDRINAVSGFAATVLDGNGTVAALNALDTVTNQDVKTTLYSALANLQAIVDWFNGVGEGFVTATRAAAVGTLPANIPFTYLAGGSDGTVDNTAWSNAFTALQGADVQWVVPLSSSGAIQAMADAHCAFMSNIMRLERRAFVGTASGTTDSAGITAAKALNSDRTSLVHLGYYDFDVNGNLVLFQPYMTASLIGAAFSGTNPGTAMTNKSLKIRGIERNLRNPTDTDVLIQGGVLPIENTPRGFKVVKSITTWLTNLNFNRVEVSTGFAMDFTARNVRDALDALRGEKGNPILLRRAVSIAQTALQALSVPEPVGPGVLAGDANNPPFKNVTASLVGDVLAVQFQCSPVIPANYIPVTIFAVPFSGSASAA